jgi:hypothetical protein
MDTENTDSMVEQNPASENHASEEITIDNQPIVIRNKHGRVITHPEKQKRTPKQLEALAKGRAVLAEARKNPGFVSKQGRPLFKYTDEDREKAKQEQDRKRRENMAKKVEQRERIVAQAEESIQRINVERTELEKAKEEEMARIHAIREMKERQAQFLKEEKERISREASDAKRRAKEEKHQLMLDSISQRIDQGLEAFKIARELEKKEKRLAKEKQRAEENMKKYGTLPFALQPIPNQQTFQFSNSVPSSIPPFVLRGRECDL